MPPPLSDAEPNEGENIKADFGEVIQTTQAKAGISRLSDAHQSRCHAYRKRPHAGVKSTSVVEQMEAWHSEP